MCQQWEDRLEGGGWGCRSRTETSEGRHAYGGTPRCQALGYGSITTLCGDLTMTTDKGNMEAEESGPGVPGCK